MPGGGIAIRILSWLLAACAAAGLCYTLFPRATWRLPETLSTRPTCLQFYSQVGTQSAFSLKGLTHDYEGCGASSIGFHTVPGWRRVLTQLKRPPAVFGSYAENYHNFGGQPGLHVVDAAGPAWMVLVFEFVGSLLLFRFMLRLLLMRLSKSD